MTRRPPRSTLFPTRRSSDLTCPWHAWRFRLADGVWADYPRGKVGVGCYPVRVVGDAVQVRRSEEHTSELQSLTNLVCRLLLEKKKKKTTHKDRLKQDKRSKH